MVGLVRPHTRLGAHGGGPGARIDAIKRVAVAAKGRRVEPRDVPEVPIPLVVVARDRAMHLQSPAPPAAQAVAEAEDAVVVGAELAALRAPAQGPDLLDGGDLDAVCRPSLGRTVEALDVCQPLGDRLLRVGPCRPLVLRARALHLP